MYGNSWAPATRKSFLFDLRTFFAWAVKRGHLLASPAAPVDFPTLSPDPPGIHTPEQVRQVLETARRQDADVCRHLALRYFAGLRRSEPAALGLRPEYVEVPAVPWFGCPSRIENWPWSPLQDLAPFLLASASAGLW